MIYSLFFPFFSLKGVNTFFFCCYFLTPGLRNSFPIFLEGSALQLQVSVEVPLKAKMADK